MKMTARMGLTQGRKSFSVAHLARKKCFASQSTSARMPTERLQRAFADFHESQKSCSLLEMGTFPFLVRLRSHLDVIVVYYFLARIFLTRIFNLSSEMPRWG